MQFSLTHSRHPAPLPSTAYLVDDNWDDWGKFRTMFQLVVYDAAGEKHEIGSLKIGQRGLAPSHTVAPGKRAPALEPQFEKLGDNCFSLGQNDNYYEALGMLGDALRIEILVGLRDCAYDLELFHRFRDEEVMAESLLRYVTESQVTARFHRLSHGNAALSQYQFGYTLPDAGVDGPPPSLAFSVTPLSQPPTNVHVLIGRNGVGKTRCLHRLAGAILAETPDPAQLGVITSAPSVGSDELSFAGLVVVSFSAFDSFPLPAITRKGMRAARIGMPQVEISQGEQTVRSRDESFARDFTESLEKCRSEPRLRRLRAALATLESDPLFAEANVSALLDGAVDEWTDVATSLFNSLSSGHKIVLLTVTRLVELVDEKTLVLIDEPEGHLHPPLLSALIRALSDLLVSRNGVAVVSTHSPVVLQEVPRSCVWFLWRSGRQARASRPEIETFGENVGILTREVFGLEVTNSGFHRLLKAAVSESGSSFETVLGKFDGQLGSEAQAMVHALLAVKDRG